MESVRKKFQFTRTLNHLIESCPVEDKLALIEAFIAYGLDDVENELQRFKGWISLMYCTYESDLCVYADEMGIS